MQDERDEKLINQGKKPPTCEFHDQDGFRLKTTSKIPAQANIQIVRYHKARKIDQKGGAANLKSVSCLKK